MSLASEAIDKKTVTYFASFLAIIIGIVSFFFLGQLEDPEFTIKSAVIVTHYPGASPEEVEQEVTEKLELALQEIYQVDYLKSISRAGVSEITVEIKPSFLSREIPQIFDEIRKKIRDASTELPPGVLKPQVNDDFGEVFGFVLAVVGDGFSDAELDKYADDVKRELSLVKGAARVERWGVQTQAIYLDVFQSRLSQLGISPQTLIDTLTNQNVVVNAGGIDLDGERLRIEALGTFRSPEEIENLTIRPSVIDQLLTGSTDASEELIRLRDFAVVRRGYVEPPSKLMRFNGQRSIGLSIAVEKGGNVVHLGKALEQRLNELKAMLPVGIEFEKVAWQSDLVTESIVGFMVSLVEAVLIVLVVLWLFMGIGNAIIVGTALVMTIQATLIVMAIWKIDLQRMSLGALVIALGMMVDNAIVVADGAFVRIQQGMNKAKAAAEAAASTSLPLLGATFIAISFFYPIYGSPESTGEYCASLFQVVAISLLASWVISMTLTPLQCIALIKAPSSNDKVNTEDAYSGKFYQRFRSILATCIKFRGITLLAVSGVLVLAILNFGFVPKMFFPDSSRLQFMVDYWAPEGTRIQQTSEDLKVIERHLQEDLRVQGVAAFVGGGPPRFYLPVEPEKQYSSYGQLIVNVSSLKALGELVDELEPWAQESIPQALVRIRRYSVGPGHAYKFEARISGPGNADPKELRRLGEEGVALLKSTPLAKDARTDWRQRVKKIVTQYDQARGRWTSVTRQDMARAMQRFYDGVVVGQYREDDDLLPIILRSNEEERKNIGGLDTVQIIPLLKNEPVPLIQVADLDVDWEDPNIWRRNRRRTITVQAEPDHATLSELRAEVASTFEAIELPPGYQFEWGAEYEDTQDSQKALLPGLIPVVVIVSLLLIALFNSYRPPLAIVLVIPFAIIGITGGLLITQQPFGFMALLGGMSLAGMMIKNSIVLLDQVNAELAQGVSPYQAIINAAVSRLRPVALAAATTILGVIPLLQDVFWVSMAVVIMGGLAVGTILTMVIVPVLYATLYKIKAPTS